MPLHLQRQVLWSYSMAIDPHNQGVSRSMWGSFSPNRIREVARQQQAPAQPAVDPMSQAANNMDVDRDMWTGYTPTPRLASPEAPSPAHQQEVHTALKLPPRRPPFLPLFGEKVAPPYQQPSVWARPFNQSMKTCIGFYETEYTVLSAEIPDTRLTQIHSIGYELQNTLAVGEVFSVTVRRDGEVMASWQDIVANNAANPAERYAFGSVRQSIPLDLRVDRTQNITVSITVHGPLPFSKTSADPLSINAKVITYGYMDQLRDTRENGFRSRVAGGERGQDRWEHITANVMRFKNNMTELAPYFAERFTEGAMGYYRAEMGTMGGAINVE